MESWVVIVICASLAVVILEGVTSQTIVYIDNGALQGATETVQGNRVDVFLGIPFAKPPVGDLRFRLPEPAENWEGVKNATAFGPACMQIGPNPYGFPDVETISEDCLTLNVFVPGSTNSSNNKAVMVWIHGGGYTTGGTAIYSFKEFAVTGDVIVVSMNYRLNVFGFLSTGDDSVPGNIGLWDQIEALKWIKKNIQYFGGDSGRVTIFGESAGGSSVVQLALANASSGLFQRFIRQSGITNSKVWVASKNAPEIAVRTGNIVGCPTTNAMALVDCLRSIDAETLIGSIVGLSSAFFLPSIDGVLLTKPISEMLKDPSVLQRLRSFDVMTGFLDGDGGVFLLNKFLDGIDPFFVRDTLIPYWTISLLNTSCTEIIKAITELYYEKNATKLETVRDYIDLLTDIVFTKSMFEIMTPHLSQEGRSTYLYYFTRKPLYGNVMIGSQSWFQRANHGDDLHFMIGSYEPFVPSATFTDDEKYLSKMMMRYWSNFAKTGNPNIPEPVPALWEEYTVNEKHYLEFGDVIVGKRSVIPERVKLWTKTIPRALARCN